MNNLLRICTWSALLVLFVAGCSGSVTAPNIVPTGNPGYLSVPLNVVVATPPSAPIATISVVASAPGFAPATSSGPCSSTGCTINVQSPPEYVEFAITLVDAGGNTLLSGTYFEDATQAALDPQPAVVFGGTPATIDLSLDPASFTIGTASSATLTALPYDAQDREIIGSTPFSTPIAITSSFLGTTLSTPALTAPNSQITVSYDGSAGSAVTLSGTGGGASVISVNASIVSGPTAVNGHIFGDEKAMTVQQINAIPTAPPIPPMDAGFENRRRMLSSTQVTLAANLPPVGDQGQSNNCAVFSGVYAIMSYTSSVQRAASNPRWILTGSGNFGENPQTTFSPTFTYNQTSVNGGQDKGAYLDDVARSLLTIGAVPLSLVPFAPSTPAVSYLTSANTTIAAAFRIKNYYTIATPTNVGASVAKIKSYLAAGYPIYMAMGVDDAAGALTVSNPVYSGYDGVSSPGGHAMVFVGYDDSIAGGSFRVMNSWGTGTGDHGFFWLPYSFWTTTVQGPEALVFTRNPANTSIYNI